MEIEKTVAKAILRAVELREGSYDQEASDKMVKEIEEKNLLYCDFKQFYKMSLREACEAAMIGTNLNFGQLIYLNLNGWWNDTIDWANKILAEGDK